MIEQLQLVHQKLRPCVPPSWASSGHLQTILGHLLPSTRMTGGESCLIALDEPDEQLHARHWPGSKSTVIYVFHGLGGDIDSDYMHRTAQIAQRLGYSVFLINHRGCGEGAKLSKGTYHSGRGADLGNAVAYGRARYPNHLHIAVGFSLSANALLLLAAGVRGPNLPDGAIAVNAPIDLDHASVLLSRGFNRIYDVRFAIDLKKYLKTHRPDLPIQTRFWEDMRKFDELYTAPLGGFENRAHYYATSSAGPHLEKIAVPTVMLSALDDPFVSGTHYRNVKVSNQVVLHLENHGGHMGYLEKKGLGYNRWLDYALEQYLMSMAGETII